MPDESLPRLTRATLPCPRPGPQVALPYPLTSTSLRQLNYLVPATCCVIILFVFDLPAYTSPTNFPAVLSLFLLYG